MYVLCFNFVFLIDVLRRVIFYRMGQRCGCPARPRDLGVLERARSPFMRARGALCVALLAGRQTAVTCRCLYSMHFECKAPGQAPILDQASMLRCPLTKNI